MNYPYLLFDADNTLFNFDRANQEAFHAVCRQFDIPDSDETFARPPFLGSEVTGDHRFYNKQMRANPFKNWRATLPKAFQ